MIKYGLLLAFMVSLTCYGQKKELKTSDSGTTSCLLVEKAFVKKNGEPTDHKEIYLRCSVQDYYIKLCESKVTKKELEKYLDKGISVRMEIKEGSWDICEGDPVMQSRIGTYAVILSIEEK